MYVAVHNCAMVAGNSVGEKIFKSNVDSANSIPRMQSK